MLKDLQKEFALKDLGDLHYFLGIEVKSSNDGLVLSQGMYVVDILTRIRMDKAKSVDTPLAIYKKNEVNLMALFLGGRCNTL